MFAVLDQLDGQGMADTLAGNARATFGRQAFELLLVAGWADLHNADTVATDASGRVLPGMEQAKAYGGPGTPLVAEFATAELAVLLGRSVGSADVLVRDALDLRHRHPQLWARLEQTARLAVTAPPTVTGHPTLTVDPGTGAVVDLGVVLDLEAVEPVPVWAARKVAQACHTAGLTRDQARFVDRVTTPLLGCVPWARFERLLAAAIIEADPAAAKKRAEAEATRQGVRIGPSTEHGLITLIINAQAGRMIAGKAMIDR